MKKYKTSFVSDLTDFNPATRNIFDWNWQSKPSSL